MPVFGNVPGKCATRGRNYLSQHELRMQQLVIVNHRPQCFSHPTHSCAKRAMSRVYGCLATCGSPLCCYYYWLPMSSVNSRENHTSLQEKYTIFKYTRTLMYDCTSPHGNHTSRFLHIVNARCLPPCCMILPTDRLALFGLIRFPTFLNLSKINNIDSVEYVPVAIWMKRVRVAQVRANEPAFLRETRSGPIFGTVVCQFGSSQGGYNREGSIWNSFQ